MVDLGIRLKLFSRKWEVRRPDPEAKAMPTKAREHANQEKEYLNGAGIILKLPAIKIELEKLSG